MRTQEEERKRQEDAELLVKREIYLNQSCLLDELMKYGDLEETALNQFQYDNVTNWYTTWDEVEGKEAECVACCEMRAVDENNYCEECFEGEPKEIFEWWAISSWLAKKLIERGEAVLDNDFGTWWGRCTAGQAIACDYAIQELACEVFNPKV